jgi:hypothetical protein
MPTTSSSSQTTHTWSPLGPFPYAADFFGDGSLYVIDTPGHLYGHVNLLARVAAGRWIYLGGDCCHDFRILSGEKDVAEYDDGHSGVRSVHTDTEVAKGSLGRIKELMGMSGGKDTGGGKVEIEVVVAHDGGWMRRNRDKFFPGAL